MFWWIERTRMGAVIRAAAEKPEMVDVLGIDARRVHMTVFAIGTALALVAGVLAAPLYSVYPNMGDGFLIISFVVVVIGGLGSVSGAFWSALVIGLVDTLGKAYAPKLAGLAVYVLMAAVLIWRPVGPVRAAHMSAAERALMLPRAVAVGLGLAAALLAVLPLLVSPYYVELGTYALISAMLALSLQLLVGCTGLVSLGHAAFYGLAAYTVYLVTPASQGLSIFVTLPLAVVVAGLAALVVGALSLRTRGFFFLMVTLAFGQMLFFLFHDTKLGGGTDGAFLARPVLVDLRLAAAAHPAPAPLRRLLRVAGPAGCHVSGPGAPPALAVRARARGHPRQRAPHAGAGLRHVPLQARGLHHCRHAGGRGGPHVGHAPGLREPRADRLAPLGRGAADDPAGRPHHAARPHPRRAGLHGAGRGRAD